MQAFNKMTSDYDSSAVTSCKFGLGSYFRLVQPKIFSQPEITSPVEIITSNCCHACVLCNKQVVLPWRCHPGSAGIEECLSHGGNSGVRMPPMQLLILEKPAAVGMFWSIPVKTKRKGMVGLYLGRGPDQLLQAKSESSIGKHERFPMFLILWCPLSPAPAGCESQCFHRDIACAKLVIPCRESLSCPWL